MRTGQLRGDSPPRCQPRRGQAREGRGRGRLTRPPRNCPGRPASPRSARRFPSCSICGRLTPSGASAPPGASVLRGGPVRPSSPQCPTRAIRPRLSARAGALRCASAPPPELPAGRGASPPSARGRESPPPFSVPPPSRPPFPGSAAKNGLERQAREFVAPLPRALAPSWGAALGAQGRQPHTWSGPWRRPSVLASSSQIGRAHV